MQTLKALLEKKDEEIRNIKAASESVVEKAQHDQFGLRREHEELVLSLEKLKAEVMYEQSRTYEATTTIQTLKKQSEKSAQNKTSEIMELKVRCLCVYVCVYEGYELIGQ